MRLIKKKKIVNPDIKIDFFSTLFSSGFYSGFFPFASGTFGSAVSLLIFLVPEFRNPFYLTVLIIISLLIGTVTSTKMMKRYGDDPSVVVIDEFAGMWITVLISLFASFDIINLIIGFLAFRFFDIVKLYPASYFDKLKSGFGVMFDDVIAGIYGGIVTVILLLIIQNLI